MTHINFLSWRLQHHTLPQCQNTNNRDFQIRWKGRKLKQRGEEKYLTCRVRYFLALLLSFLARHSALTGGQSSTQWRPVEALLNECTEWTFCHLEGVRKQTNNKEKNNTHISSCWRSFLVHLPQHWTHKVEEEVLSCCLFDKKWCVQDGNEYEVQHLVPLVRQNFNTVCKIRSSYYSSDKERFCT